MVYLNSLVLCSCPGCVSGFVNVWAVEARVFLSMVEPVVDGFGSWSEVDRRMSGRSKPGKEVLLVERDTGFYNMKTSSCSQSPALFVGYCSPA